MSPVTSRLARCNSAGKAISGSCPAEAQARVGVVLEGGQLAGQPDQHLSVRGGADGLGPHHQHPAHPRGADPASDTTASGPTHHHASATHHTHTGGNQS